MNVRELRDALTSVPDAPEAALRLTPEIEDGIANSIATLEGDAAIAAIRAEPYWPKWDGPWWHMVLLWELGVGARIPHRAARAMVDSLNGLPLHTFPLTDDDWPAEVEHARGAACHCALGCMDQVLTECGIDVDLELPWVLPWYTRYQMSDGGLNCDETAYAVTTECASSMVGTVPVIEAMLRRGSSAWLERAADFMISRALQLGSPTVHNADERTAARAWPAAVFPRFYFYDVLRGAAALVRWIELARMPVPVAALAILAERRDPIVTVERAVPELGTWRGHAGTWMREPVTKSFPLAITTGTVGAPSPRLTAQWQRVRRGAIALIDEGLVT